MVDGVVLFHLHAGSFKVSTLLAIRCYYGIGRISSGEMLDGIIPMNAGEGWLKKNKEILFF